MLAPRERAMADLGSRDIELSASSHIVSKGYLRTDLEGLCDRGWRRSRQGYQLFERKADCVALVLVILPVNLTVLERVDRVRERERRILSDLVR